MFRSSFTVQIGGVQIACAVGIGRAEQHQISGKLKPFFNAKNVADPNVLTDHLSTTHSASQPSHTYQAQSALYPQTIEHYRLELLFFYAIEHSIIGAIIVVMSLLHTYAYTQMILGGRG